MTTRNDRLAALESEIGVVIHRVRRVLAERARAVHPELTTASYLLLGHLVKHGALRSSALVETFGVDKGAVSRQVQQLVDLGLAERRRDPDDGRAQLVTATPTALAATAEVSAQRRKLLADRLRDWTEDDLAQLVERLGRYNDALG